MVRVKWNRVRVRELRVSNLGIELGLGLELGLELGFGLGIGL